MIYFDNAATGGFKIRAVIDAAETVIRHLSANPGRSGHRLSITGAKIANDTRTIISKYFGCSPDRVIFTKNCTEALNTAIFGSVKKGGHVITTVYEHNSVLRPLFALKNSGAITLDVVAPEPDKNIVHAIKEKITPNTYLIATTAASNVTGEELPVSEIGALANEFGLLYLVDGAQGGGHTNLNLKEQNITFLALAGHKGLNGIMGSGVLCLDDNADLTPLTFGGTGSESFNLNQPQAYPERLESGTLNLPAIAALGEGVRHIKNNSQFREHIIAMTDYMINGLKQIKSITVYSAPNGTGIVAFSLSGIDSAEVADILNSEFDIAVRGGFHCAPLMHKHLKTDSDGLVRASLAVQNTTREINFFLRAVEKIADR